ncbi:MAG: carboxypeptidase regulatory-like domain-containing protein, partial [Bacteroidetes bacterium]|nr:carboxypeptidase regulatory-like domain-containing protein [Bacteroidota bacterium]
MYSTKINGQVMEFGTSGLLYRSNKLMYDRATKTLWHQFTGEPVVGALSYGLSVSERVREQGSQADIQIFQHETSNSSLDVPASMVMRSGEYRRRVTANDAKGAASVSETGQFRYTTDMGSFTFITHSALDGAEILGVSVTVRSTEGGYSPINPFVNATSVSFSDSLVVGNYEFLSRKDGFTDSTFAALIRKNERTTVNIDLRPLSSRLSGTVHDASGVPVVDASVVVRPSGGETEFKAFTGFDGSFSLSLAAGNYAIRVIKAGFSPSADFTFTLATNQHLILPVPIVIRTDDILLSGRVTDQDGIPVSLVLIVARGPGALYEIVTAGDGSYTLALSEGNWEISAEKGGFISPGRRSISVVRGDHVQHFDFSLIREASRVSGRVEALVRRLDGTLDIQTLAVATVTAIPIVGTPVTVQTDSRGQFKLNLARGSYSIHASAEGHVDSESFEFILDIGQSIEGVRLLAVAHDALISGRVLSIDGSPLVDAYVAGSSGASTRSSIGGTFSLSVRATPQQIRATAEGFVRSGSLRLAPGTGGHLSGIDLLLRPHAGSISGRVLAGAQPLAGAVVKAMSGSSVIEAVTDQNGAYRLNLTSGSWTVQSEDPRFESKSHISLFLQPGQTSEGQDII